MEMNEKEMNRQELNMNEAEEVAGGVTAGGLRNKPAPKDGYYIHQITAHDTVWGLSRKYGVSMDAIVKANPSIEDKRLIRTGFWLYIPKK